ncbi:MAG: hypothetical protein WCI21_02660, partial [Alphaproteobacteria bacterium]
MPSMESAQLDPSTFQTRIAVARGLLKPRVQPEPVWPVVASAALFAVCALGLAGAVISAPTFKAGAPAGAPKFTPVVEGKLTK